MIAPTHSGRGRGPKRSLDEARILSHQWQESGLCKQVWCREQGILPSTLQSCLLRINRVANAATTAPPTFIELRRRLASTGEARMLRLSLAGSTATAEVTIAELGELIQRLSEARS